LQAATARRGGEGALRGCARRREEKNFRSSVRVTNLTVTHLEMAFSNPSSVFAFQIRPDKLAQKEKKFVALSRQNLSMEARQ